MIHYRLHDHALAIRAWVRGARYVTHNKQIALGSPGHERQVSGAIPASVGKSVPRIGHCGPWRGGGKWPTAAGLIKASGGGEDGPRRMSKGGSRESEPVKETRSDVRESRHRKYLRVALSGETKVLLILNCLIALNRHGFWVCATVSKKLFFSALKGVRKALGYNRFGSDAWQVLGLFFKVTLTFR